MSLADFQQLIREMYFEKDVARGVDGTFMWLMEEVGELAAALRSGTHEERLGEFADVLAWLATIANVAGVDLSRGRHAEVRLGLPRLRPVRLHLRRRGEAMTPEPRSCSATVRSPLRGRRSGGRHCACAACAATLPAWQAPGADAPQIVDLRARLRRPLQGRLLDACRSHARRRQRTARRRSRAHVPDGDGVPSRVAPRLQKPIALAAGEQSLRAAVRQDRPAQVASCTVALAQRRPA